MLVFNESYRGSVDNSKNYYVSKYKHFMEQFIPKYQCGFRKGFNVRTVSLECQRNAKDLLIKEKDLKRSLESI